MMRYFKMPKVQMALSLLLIVLSNLLHNFSFFILLYYIAALIITQVIDYLFLKIRHVEIFFLSAAMVSGSIITLLNAPNNPILMLGVIILLAMISKHFIRLDKKHIFNPAGFGLFFGSLLFKTTVSWWGVSFQNLGVISIASVFFFLILITPGYVSMLRMRRFKISIPFFITYFLLTMFTDLFFKIPLSITTILDPTVIFFGLVMLPEPMTTPNRPTVQILFGIFVAVVSILISNPLISSSMPFLRAMPDVLIGSLLLGNVVFFSFR